MRILLFLAVLAAGNAADAQSCPAADSALGAVGKFEAPKGKYDKFTDSTIIVGAPMYEVPMSGPSVTAMVRTGWAGKLPTDTTSTLVSAEFKQEGVGGAIVGGRTGDAPVNASMAKFGDVKDVKFVLDDSVRFSLPIVSNTAKVQKAGIFNPEALIETLTFVIPADVRRKMVGTKEGRMRIGDYEIGVGKKTLNSLRDVTRFLICSSTVASK